MTKKFDVVIGNPPYQEEAKGQTTSQMPVYHHFVDAAHQLGRKAILITPARFLFDAGYTPKAWNRKMREDAHLSVPYYVSDSSQLFPGTDIKGGVAVTYRDEARLFEPIGTFTKYRELDEIIRKVEHRAQGASIATLFTSSRSYRYTAAMHADYPEARGLMPKGDRYKLNTRTFEQLPFLYKENRPPDGRDYVGVTGLVSRERVTRWILSKYIAGPEALSRFKVSVPKASGSGVFGEVTARPVVLEPNVAVSGTFITVGAFHTRGEAQSCMKYMQTKFSRAMLGVLKVTQDNMARVWEHVPLQDFTEASDIDWSRSIEEIDQQLYAKYGLSGEEIEFIETHVQPMD